MAFERTMHSARPTPLALLLAPAALLAFGRPGLAEDLPPQQTVAHSGVYKSTSSGKQKPWAETWDFTDEDTVTIVVSDGKARWDYKSDGRVVIQDYPAKQSAEFGGKRLAAGTATRMTYKMAPIRWELGYEAVAKATESKPEALGQDTIAGQSCTRLRYDSAQYGTPEYCVAKNGIVLRFVNQSSNAEIRYEAVSVTPGAPDAKAFTIPADLQINERRL
jgi:hypothetical protein